MQHFLFALAMAGAASACVSHVDAGPAPGTEGSASLTLLRASGTREEIAVAGPPGELRLAFHDSENHCGLSLVAASPRVGDITEEAKARRIRIDLWIDERDAPGLVEGNAGSARARAGFLVEAPTVELTRNRGATLEDNWRSVGGGTVTASSTGGGIGAPVTIDLDGIVLRGRDDEGDALLSGRIVAKLGALQAIGKPGGCPANVPGRAR